MIHSWHRVRDIAHGGGLKCANHNKKTPSGKPPGVLMSFQIYEHHVSGGVSVRERGRSRLATKLTATHAISAVVTQVAIAISNGNTATVVT